jgi:acetyl esterase/lipase
MRTALAIVFPLLGVGLAAAPAQAQATNPLVEPLQRGPYNVGTTLFTATMSGGRVARAQVFYPTMATPDPAATYRVVVPAGFYDVRSRLGAAIDAVAVPGRFPLVAWDHGGAGGDQQRITQLPLHEHMATHGLVTIVAPHANDRAVRARDLPILIAHALARSAQAGDILHGSIDPERIGIGGYSSGGATALDVAAGWNRSAEDPPLPPIRAMVLFEPGREVPADLSSITTPYLFLRGTQLALFAGGFSAQEFFDSLLAQTPLALPRVEVRTPDAVHLNYQTGACDLIDHAREWALNTVPGIAEPLTTLTASSAAATAAFNNWNMGERLFATNGAGFGGGRNVCNRVGVASVRSLDQDGDGETDSPPFQPIDPKYTPRVAPEQEVMVELITHYTVAFYKRHLEGDERYARYLAPGWAIRHDLPAEVTIAE